jgi:hypothetical protein
MGLIFEDSKKNKLLISENIIIKNKIKKLARSYLISKQNDENFT